MISSSGEFFINSFSSSELFFLPKTIPGSISAPFFSVRENSPNPERNPLNAKLKALRHHGTFLSSIFVHPAAIAPG
ncbi:MAG TPA: hypothetical protein VH308_05395, partial [Terracidiphilus sp.]|nr:hypothetical protein [Terracidiphilus sp.]